MDFWPAGLGQVELGALLLHLGPELWVLLWGARAQERPARHGGVVVLAVNVVPGVLLWVHEMLALCCAVLQQVWDPGGAWRLHSLRLGVNAGENAWHHPRALGVWAVGNSAGRDVVQGEQVLVVMGCARALLVLNSQSRSSACGCLRCRDCRRQKRRRSPDSLKLRLKYLLRIQGTWRFACLIAAWCANLSVSLNFVKLPASLLLV